MEKKGLQENMNFKVRILLFFCILLLFSCDESMVFLKNETLQERFHFEESKEGAPKEQEDLEVQKNEKRADEIAFSESDGGEDQREGMLDSTDVSDAGEPVESTKEVLAEEESEAQRKVRDCLSIEIQCTAEELCIRKSDIFYEVVGIGRPRIQLVLHLKEELFCAFQKHLWKLDSPVGSLARLSNDSGLHVTYVIDVKGLYRVTVTSLHQSGISVRQEFQFLSSQ